MAGDRKGDRSPVDTGEVRLALPASPEFLRLARLTATGLASRMAFTFDEVEDLRIAIDELCFALVGTRGRAGTITLRYSMTGTGLVVEGGGHFEDGAADEAPVLSAFSEQILAAVADEHELAAGPDGPTFRLLKRRATG